LYIALAVFAAAALIAGPVALAKPAGDAAAPQRTISVNGSAQASLKPDIATIDIGAYSEKPTVEAAQEDNDALMVKIMAALKAQGVDTDKDVQTINYSISQSYDKDNKTVVGYRINNSVRVKVRNLDKLGDILSAVGTAGANLVSNIGFTKEDSEDAYNQLVAKAIADARARAETLAKSAGAKLGAVVCVSENGSYYPPTPIYYTRGAMDAAAGSAPISSGSLTLSANVSITFELQ
jgi:uncharacterized protein YggE